MAEIIVLEDWRETGQQNEILKLFRRKNPAGADSQSSHCDYPTSRSGASANLSDLYEQANAVLMRHYDGDVRVPSVVANKCIELLQVLGKHTKPE